MTMHESSRAIRFGFGRRVQCEMPSCRASARAVIAWQATPNSIEWREVFCAPHATDMVEGMQSQGHRAEKVA